MSDEFVAKEEVAPEIILGEQDVPKAIELLGAEAMNAAGLLAEFGP